MVAIAWFGWQVMGEGGRGQVVAVVMSGLDDDDIGWLTMVVVISGLGL